MLEYLVISYSKALPTDKIRVCQEVEDEGRLPAITVQEEEDKSFRAIE